jgi:hypothetical protein
MSYILQNLADIWGFTIVPHMFKSEIPSFTDKILQACKAATRNGDWQPPKEAGEKNDCCCPLRVLWISDSESLNSLSRVQSLSFMRGYDLREFPDKDFNFYILGQGFRKIAETTGF